MPQARPEVLDAIASLQRLAELFAARRRQLAREADLTETQWRALEEAEGEEFMPSMFARRRACTPAAVSRTLRQLLDRGLVRASIGASDGRQRLYRLTAKGRHTLEALREQRARAIETVWQDFSAEQLRAFTRFASDLASRLEAYLGSH